MALSSSESSDPKRRWKHEVFLSFRGEDTRKSFVDRLYTAFLQKNIETFIGDGELDRGEVIPHHLLEAIEECCITIVILSPNYASSTWCLDELGKILESKKALGVQVFPVFYGVDPSDVEHQRGIFSKAFEEHEERFKKDPVKIQKWRDALMEIARISGWNFKDRISEAKLIEEIVETVWKRLQPILSHHDGGLVGIESKITEMFSLLRLGLSNVQFIGIWGMGGIGKTTLARVVYERIYNQFEYSCFLINVREYGLAQLQEHLLSRLKLGSMEIEKSFDFELRKKAIRQLLCNKKVLIVLDDVNDKNQLENLAGNHDWFGPGSRVIVTTRDKHLLNAHGISGIYHIPLLNRYESMELFCQKAFRSVQPPTEYLEISEFVVSYAGGLPLALKVFGSFLFGRSRQDWESALDRIKKVPIKIIVDTLKRSYDALDEIEKETFLDIACFFKGLARDYVIQTLRNCGFDPSIALQALLDKSLVSYDGKVLAMHDSLQQMGRNIVWQESPHEPGGRSRLWSKDDIDHVLRDNTGTDAIRGIVQLPDEPCEVHSDPNAFLKMRNLRLLICRNLYLPGGLNGLSFSLRVLEWEAYPLKDLRHVTQLQHLVDLKLHHSKIKQLWTGKPLLGKLKSIDLSHSGDLIETPDFSGVPNLERLILEGCISVVDVHPSLGQLKKLVELNLKGCRELEIPSVVLATRQIATQTDDYNEGYGPSEPMTKEKSERPLPETGARSIHHDNPTASSDPRDTTASWSYFHTLKISDESQLMELPTRLHSLRIVACHSLESLPEKLIKECPELFDLQIIDCHSLKYFGDGRYPAPLRTLYIDKCRNLQFLPPPDKMRNFEFLERLENLSIGSSCVDSLKSFPLNLFPKLKTLCVWDCPNLETFSIIEGFHDYYLSLESLEIRDCTKLASFPIKGLPAPNLVSFTISNCEILNSLPRNMTALKSLRSLFILKCPQLESIPEGGLPSSLNLLSIAFCNKLLPKKEWNLKRLDSLSSLDIESGCLRMKSFPDEELLPPNLNSLRISNLSDLTVLDYRGLEHLTALESMEIDGCHKLSSLPNKGLPSSLTFLSVKDSPMLTLKLLPKSGAEWHKIAHIPNIEIDGNLISSNVTVGSFI